MPKKKGRRDNRYCCRKVACPIGRVVSISRSGFRVHAPCALRIKAQQKVSLNLQTADGTLQVRARVAWVIADFEESWLGMELIKPNDKVVAAFNRVILKSKPERSTQLRSTRVVKRIERWARRKTAALTAKLTPAT